MNCEIEQTEFKKTIKQINKKTKQNCKLLWRGGEGPVAYNA